jgi:hypothetical protein
MNRDRALERWISSEIKNVRPLLIWRNDAGEYEVFGHYRIVQERQLYRVFKRKHDQGVFSSTRLALSWCIADHNRQHELSRDLAALDHELQQVSSDLTVRVGIAERSRRSQFREDVFTKLQGRIIRRKELEHRLDKCVDLAKYWQQRGFRYETARTIRN